MKFSKNSLIYLLLILALASLMRILFIDSIPTGFFCDEAANGYESYSILETLRDRYGNFLPPFFNIFGNDAREPIYIYLTVPFIKLFGLNEFSTRLPAALIGICTIVAVYFLVQEAFNQKVALISALLLSISPWHIHFNRIAFRLNLLPLLFCLGILFFIKSFKKPKYLPISSLFFGLSLYTYSSARVFVSLFLLGITIIFWKHLWKNKTSTIISFILFLCIFVPLFKFWISPAGMARAKGTGIESNLIVIVQNYFSHFSPNFLFLKGTSAITENPAKIGELYLFEIFTVPLGLLKLFQNKTKIRIILLLWLLLYPIPAIFTGLPSPQRSIVGVPVFAIISALGIIYLIDYFKRRQIINVFIGFILLIHLMVFTHQYFLKYPSEAAIIYNYGIKDAIKFSQKSLYSGFVMSSDTNSGWFAIYDFVAFIPFYTLYPPQEYQRSPIPPWVRGSQDKIYSLDKYHLMSISKQNSLNEKYLYILRPEEIFKLKEKGYNWKEIHSVKDSEGIEYFKLVEISKKN